MKSIAEEFCCRNLCSPKAGVEGVVPTVVSVHLRFLGLLLFKLPEEVFQIPEPGINEL